jgi:putative phosphoesterase
MIIGLLSDTHGHRAFTAQAIARLAAENVEAVLHAGDLGSEAIVHDLVEAFGAKGIPVYAALGNVDLYDLEGQTPFEYSGVQVRRFWPGLSLGGWTIAVAHGDDPRQMHTLETHPALDLLVTGHTHVAEDRRDTRPRVVNPGAVVRAVQPSVAVLDTATAEVRFLDLPRGGEDLRRGRSIR